MLKLYKKENGKLLYWEVWGNGKKTATIHWGAAGERGESKNISVLFKSSLVRKIQKEIAKKRSEGFEEIEFFHVLAVEYSIKGMGTEKDLEKRYRLEDLLNETLGWTGLGHCDGGSIGSDTMEAACLVVDFEIAEKVIKEDLADTEFANYTRIYKENE